MANSVQVTFGANIEPLVSAVEGAKKAIEGFVAAFAVDKLGEFVEAYAKMGAQIENNARQFGTSTAYVQELGYVAKMAGGDQQSLVTSLGRLQMELQQAQNPTTRQALALKALGLSAKELIGLPLREQIGRIADAFTHYADGTNKSAIAQVLFRNSSGEMIGLLDQGRAGLESYYKQAEETGAVVSGKTVKALDALDKDLVALKASFTGLAEVMVSQFAGALDAAAKGTEKLIGRIVMLTETGHLGEYLKTLVSGVIEQMKTIGPEGMGAVAAGPEVQAQLQKLQTDLQQNLHKIISGALAEFDQELNKPPNEGGGGKPQAPAMDVTGRDQLAAEIEGYQARITAAQAFYQQQAELINSAARTYGIGEQQKTALLIAAVQARLKVQEAEFGAEEKLQGVTAQQLQKMLDEQIKDEQKAKADIQKINDQALQEYEKEWQSTLSTITGAFNSQLRGLLAGTESWSQAWRKMLGDLIIKFIEFCEEITVKWAATQLATAFGNGPKSMLSGLIGGGGQDAAITANTTALGTLTEQIITLTGALTGQTATAAASSATSGAGGIAGLFAGITSIASIFGFASGTDNILAGGLAVVHPGETIVPARGSGPFTGASLGGGDTHIHNWNIAAWDGASVQRWLTQGGAQQLARAMQSVYRINPSFAPA